MGYNKKVKPEYWNVGKLECWDPSITRMLFFSSFHCSTILLINNMVKADSDVHRNNHAQRTWISRLY